jgi:hypothetical protein
MPREIKLSIDKNVATLEWPDKGESCQGFWLEVITNTTTEQHVHLNIDGDERTVSGKGGGASLTNFKLEDGTAKVVATFTYGDKSAPKPSELQPAASGNSRIGVVRFVAVAAENEPGADGGDTYYDAVLGVRGFIM